MVDTISMRLSLNELIFDTRTVVCRYKRVRQTGLACEESDVAGTDPTLVIPLSRTKYRHSLPFTLFNMYT